MRFIPGAVLSLIFSTVAARPHIPVSGTLAATRDIEVLEHSAPEGHAKFVVPCPGCIGGDSKADESLVLDLVVNPKVDWATSEVILNEHALDVFRGSHYSGFLIPDRAGTFHNVDLHCDGYLFTPSADDPLLDAELNIQFKIVGPFASIDVDVSIMRPLSPSTRQFHVRSQGQDWEDDIYLPYLDSPLAGSRTEVDGMSESGQSDPFDMAGELETLRLLESQAQQLSTQISAKKKAIAYALKQDQDKLCLKHLVKECDGVICAAKAVLHRICDKVGIQTDPSYQLVSIQKQQKIALSSDPKHHVDNCTDEKAYGAEAVNIPLMLTKNGTHAFAGFDLANPPNPLVKALQIIAAVLGISAFLTFLKRRCMSMRKRVERRADIEERRNARAYRRAARRALMRKRWDNFVTAINCFKCGPEPRIEDYEEKRALILQDAFLEQDLDQAEKGEVMEAEIRELRYAHEIVSSLVRVDEHRYEMITPVNDPPPPLVPLPYTPMDSRSRANSTYTLPSYTSESLPDYSSRPDDTPSSSSMVNGYTPSTSESRGRESPISPISEYSQQTRFTPTSSIRETSPRPSEETLRTRQSRDTECR